MSRIDLAKSLLGKGRQDDALYQLHLIVREKESNAKDIFEAGNLYHQIGVIDKAIHCFEKAVEIDPHFTDASIALSVVLNDIGHYERAREIFENAEKKLEETQIDQPMEKLPISALFAQKHHDLGLMYFSHHRFAEARIEIEKAIKLDRNSPRYFIDLAKALLKMGQHELAKQTLNSCIKEHPKFIPARINLGVIFLSEGNAPQAQKEWKKVQSMDPSNQDIIHYLKMIENSGPNQRANSLPT